MKGTIGRLSDILSGKQKDSRTETAQEPTIKGYKFVSGDLRSYEGDRSQWTPGVMLTYNGEVEPGSRGFHASYNLYSAFNNNPGDRLFEVEARGVLYGRGYMFAAKEMMLTREIDLKSLSVGYAIGCARHLLPNFEKKYPNDALPRKAIEAAENWLKEPTEENRISARSIAWSFPSVVHSDLAADWCAGSAAWFAGSAALAAAESAARSAAESVALSSQYTDYSYTAYSATEEKWRANLLEELVKKHYL